MESKVKIIFETLDRGVLVTAEDQGVTERLAYATSAEALDAVAQALGVPLHQHALEKPLRTPVAPTPDDRYAEEGIPQADLPPAAPPPTRRIGLSQPRKSAPPVGRRGVS